jgi:antibiotic biosynthesis monooxygenase (ABM) superfamily enzyme
MNALSSLLLFDGSGPLLAPMLLLINTLLDYILTFALHAYFFVFLVSTTCRFWS